MDDSPGPLIASGRAADLFDIGDGRVLRRHRSDPPHDLDAEARVMRHVARHGYPVPAVVSVDGRDLVMERIEGPTMFEAIESSPWSWPKHARLLAKMQRRLAEIDAPDWLVSGRDARGDSVLHLDLHPENVIMSPDGAVLVDWTDAAGGPAGFDAALTWVRLSTVEASSPRDELARRAFSQAFRRLRGRRILDPYRTAACDHRLADSDTSPDDRQAVAALRRRLTSSG